MAAQKPLPSTASNARWWMAFARPAVLNYLEHEGGLVELGKELAKAVSRPTPWKHSVLSRFSGKGECSADLAAAISVFFGLPRPAFVARSIKEATEMERIAKKYDAIAMDPREAQILELEEKLEAKKRELEIEVAQEARIEGRGHDGHTQRSSRRRSR